MKCDRKACRLVPAALALGLAACATLPQGGTLQALELEVVTAMGAPGPAARCELDSSEGAWSATAPGRVTVTTGAGPLRVRCQAADGAAAGDLTVQARVRGARWQRTLVGAGVGAVAGGVLGAATSRRDPNAICCTGPEFGAYVGAVGGLLVGTTIGALTAHPAYEYPARLRIVLAPPTDAGPPR